MNYIIKWFLKGSHSTGFLEIEWLASKISVPGEKRDKNEKNQ